MADDIARDTGTSTTWLSASFSVSLIISALLGPRAGRLIDRGSGNAVLAVSNLLFAGGLVLLHVAQSLLVLQVAWIVLGIGMGFGLYDAAFAVAGPHLRHQCARRDHRHHPVRGLRQHHRLAAHGMGRIDDRLARHLPRLGGAAFFVALPLNYWCLPRPTMAVSEKHTADKPVRSTGR